MLILEYFWFTTLICTVVKMYGILLCIIPWINSVILRHYRLFRVYSVVNEYRFNFSVIYFFLNVKRTIFKWHKFGNVDFSVERKPFFTLLDRRISAYAHLTYSTLVFNRSSETSFTTRRQYILHVSWKINVKKWKPFSPDRIPRSRSGTVLRVDGRPRVQNDRIAFPYIAGRV